MVSDFEDDWHISTFSGGGGCVEAVHRGDAVLVRHSKDRTGARLSFTENEWDAFVLGVKQGEFDIVDRTA